MELAFPSSHRGIMSKPRQCGIFGTDFCPGIAAQEVKAACQERHRLAGQRETVTQSLHAIGHAYHFVDLERGVRRNGKLIASDIREQIATIRAIAQQEGLSQACLDRIEKAERIVPKMQATIEFVSRYVHRIGKCIFSD
jgi:hypothetical protein